MKRELRNLLTLTNLRSFESLILRGATCKVQNASLRNASLYGADLTGANLKGADLYRADLTNAIITNADLTQANLCRTTMPDGKISMQGCTQF